MISIENLTKTYEKKEVLNIDKLSIKKGERFVMDRFVPHKLEAYDGPVKFIEISTFHEDDDSYRIYR